ncbi:Myosin-4 [Hordeum vulgare]|nr:Myosin-4 [Hordeum vulgare]KAI5000309.1 hypothetical protein ZWY2020_004898 [Hordeum vulgare]
MPTAGLPEIASPTPSDTICEAFDVGYSEEEVALLVDAVIPQDDPARLGLKMTDRVQVAQCVVHRRTSATAIRPWHGPISKVCLAKLTLLDFIREDSWQVVQKNNMRWKAVAPPPPLVRITVDEIREVRASRCDAPDEAGVSYIEPQSICNPTVVVGLCS